MEGGEEWEWEDLTPLLHCANKIPQISRNPGKLILSRWGTKADSDRTHDHHRLNQICNLFFFIPEYSGPPRTTLNREDPTEWTDYRGRGQGT